MKKTLLTLALALFAGGAVAQLPSHEKYVQKVPTDASGNSLSFYEYLKAWDEKNPKVTEDDQFYIGRVRPAQRFVDTSTQVDPTMTQDRKMLWWCPAGVADTYWSSLPRYIFNADAFSMWSYCDIHGNWADGWCRVPGAFSDAAHKNGVENGCIIFFDSSVSTTSDTYKILSYLCTKTNGEYENVRKLIRFMKYYGIDGLGVNPEGSLGSMLASETQKMLAAAHRIAEEEGWHLTIHWYDAQTNYGSVNWQNQLSSSNSNWFQLSDEEWPTSTCYFLNYNWYSSHLTNSVNTATSLGRSSYDVYAGFDIQGRAIYGSYNAVAGQGWEYLPDYPVSIGIWGAHGKNMLYENANEYGSDAVSVQSLYQKKQEQFFCSGTRNVLNAPAVTNTVKSFGYNQMQRFHGMSRFIPARSVLSTLPFVTYFSLGNGLRYNVEGKTSFDQEWYNLGVQDMLPTWRWWISDDAGNVPESPIEVEFTSADAWHAGHALKFSGATDKSDVRLFKTQWEVPADATITVRYKLVSGSHQGMNLIWTADGTTFQSHAVPAVAAKGEWQAMEVKASEIGMSTVKTLGLSFEGTTSDYEMLIGEISIDNHATYNPVQPQIQTAEFLGATYGTADVKLIWKSKDADSEKPWEPIYNDEVDTWYFEVYAQNEGGEPYVCATTTQWAAYVVGLPMSTDKTERIRYGVCAVAPDGHTRSEISWTDYSARPDDVFNTSDEIVLSQSVIKPGEEFTVGYADPYHPASNWVIQSSATEEVVATANDVTSLTTSIDAVGTYDLVVDGTVHSGMVQISPEETGAVPRIESLTLDKTAAEVDETVTATLSVERLGEGKVSKGLVIEDPTMLRLSSTIGASTPFTIAFWMKPTAWAHGKYGTNLLNKRDYSGSWPHNNWGTFWMHIWPEVQVYSQVNPNIISWTQNGNTDGNNAAWFPNGNRHESPNLACAANDISLQLDTWYHVAISVSSTKQALFINGKRVALQNVNWGGINTQNGCSSTQPVYIGGTNVYHGGFIGVIDDLQYWTVYTQDASEFLLEAMNGYDGKEIPANLKGYWDFEGSPMVGSTVGVLSKFENKGKAGASLVAETMYLEGASGENPDASTVPTMLKADNDVCGHPCIPGSLDITTATTWETTDDATTLEADGSNAITFAQSGEKPITARLENRWGADSRTVHAIIGHADGIQGVTADAAEAVTLDYTADGINLLIARDGTYRITAHTADGRTILSQTLNANGQTLATIRLDAPAGTYLLRVEGQNGVRQSFKVVKR